MDEIDTALIELLVENARMPVASLAKHLNLARSTVQARLDRLEHTGVIKGYTVRLGDKMRSERLRATVLLRGAAFSKTENYRILKPVVVPILYFKF